MQFYKYEGTGNDFIMIDNRSLQFPKQDQSIIAKLCHRRFGIGADGLILLENDAENTSVDFQMVYYNADGNQSSMCGNGGRCIVAFANFLGVIKSNCTFNAIDGLHEAEINDDIVKLKMINVETVNQLDIDTFVLNTGSPHYITFVEDVENLDVFTIGKKIRNSEPYQIDGINVNFVEKLSDNTLFVRTYERGVEDETYSCGTGVTAAAIAGLLQGFHNPINIKSLGGNLTVFAEKSENGFHNIWLQGPARHIFTGTIPLSNQ